MGVAVTRRLTLLVLLGLVWAAPAGATLKGTDVSHWNGSIDWLQVANAGYSFAYVKATEGTTLTDPTYSIDRSGATTFGLRTGAYHFARPAGTSDATRTANAISQADRFVTVAAPAPGDLPPALDLETTGGLSSASLTEWTQAFMAELAARTGVAGAIYFSPNFWKSSLADSTAFTGYRLWIAHWKVATPAIPAAGWGGLGWTFWQWTDCDAIPGFAHCADGDRFSGSSLASVAVPAVSSAAPAASALPTVVGVPQAGRVLAAVPGTWSAGWPLAFAYQWQSCDAAGGGCTPIPGATSESYTPSAADAGHALVVAVTAQGAGGAVTVASAPTVAVASGGTSGATAPAATVPPSVAGTAQAGQPLTSSVGTWTGSPTSFTYAWRRCDSAGAGCTAIPGATAAQYTATPSDIGATLSLLVTATGKGGSRTAASTPTAVVAAAPLPAPSVGSAVAQAGAAGAVSSAGGAVTATWQPGAVAVGSTLSVTATTAKLTLPGSAFSLAVSPAPPALPWPVDVAYASAPGDAVLGRAVGDGVWQAVPVLTSPALGADQTTGAYRDAAGALHLVTRLPGTFALFNPGKWGDPRRVAVGKPVVRALAATPLHVVRGPNRTFVLLGRISVASQSHLYASFGRAFVQQQGSRLGVWLHGRTTKTVQSLVLAPGGVPVRLRVAARYFPKPGVYRLRVAAIDPYGRKWTTSLPVRVP